MKWEYQAVLTLVGWWGGQNATVPGINSPMHAAKMVPRLHSFAETEPRGVRNWNAMQGGIKNKENGSKAQVKSLGCEGLSPARSTLVVLMRVRRTCPIRQRGHRIEATGSILSIFPITPLAPAPLHVAACWPGQWLASCNYNTPPGRRGQE